MKQEGLSFTANPSATKQTGAFSYCDSLTYIQRVFSTAVAPLLYSNTGFLSTATPCHGVKRGSLFPKPFGFVGVRAMLRVKIVDRLVQTSSAWLSIMTP